MKHIRLLSATGDESIDIFFFDDDKVTVHTRGNDHFKIRNYDVEVFNVGEEKPCTSPDDKVSGTDMIDAIDLRINNVKIDEIKPRMVGNTLYLQKNSDGQDVSGIFEDLRRVNVKLAEQGVQFNGRLKEVEEITETQSHEIENLETEVLMLNQLVTRLRSDIEAIYKQL